MPGDKIRLRFRKAGDLRLLSHHDLMRTVERMLRRADLPFALTAGFHPTPRLIFALSLPLGVVGCREVVELELTRSLPADEVLARLNQQAPAGLNFLSARTVEPRASAVPRRAVYRLALPPDRAAALPPAITALLGQDKVWVERLHPRPRAVNIKPYLRQILVHPDAVELDLWVTQSGSARAEEVIRLLGLGDLLADGGILERTELEIHDEVPPGTSDGPPEGPAETAPLTRTPVSTSEPEAQPATWGLSPNGPVVE